MLIISARASSRTRGTSSICRRLLTTHKPPPPPPSSDEASKRSSPRTLQRVMSGSVQNNFERLDQLKGRTADETAIGGGGANTHTVDMVNGDSHHVTATSIGQTSSLPIPSLAIDPPPPVVASPPPPVLRPVKDKIRDVERMNLVQNVTDQTEQEFADIQAQNYQAFRRMAPYIAMHRGQIVVLHVPGEVMMGLEEGDVDSNYQEDDSLNSEGDNAVQKTAVSRELAMSTMRDVLLLKTLGVKPVLIAGCRPQIRRKLEEEGIRSFFAHGNRVCDKETLIHCQSVAGHVRVQIESTLSRGLSNTPTDMGTTSVVSGNFVKAIPFGVRHGIDFKFTGIVQKLTNVDRMKRLLDEGHILLLSHLGYSPSGEVFHCRSEDVAVMAAQQLKAAKLVFLHNGEVVVDEKRRGTRGSVIHNLPISLAHAFEAKLRESLGNNIDRLRHSDMDPTSDQWRLQFLDYLQGAIAACKGGVRRVHLVSRFVEGAVIAELYTREGSGIMVTRDVYEGVRQAKPEDVQAIMQLITPLEQQGILVTRPPEQVEAEIDKFIVFERDGEVLACCQLVHYEDERFEGGSAEMCCVAVAESQRGSSLGSALLSYCMRSCALELGCTELFVLTTRSQHWFTDRGFVEASPERLPPKKRAVYNYKRKPKIYFKHISSERAADEYDLQFH